MARKFTLFLIFASLAAGCVASPASAPRAPATAIPIVQAAAEPTSLPAPTASLTPPATAVEASPTAGPAPAGDAAAFYREGNVYLEQQEYDKAIEQFQQAVALNPDYADAYYGLGRAYASKPWFNLTENDIRRAIANFERAIRLKPDFAEAYQERGRASFYLGMVSEAEADANRAIKLKPDYAEAYNLRGNASFAQGDTGSALANFNRAIDLKPDYAWAYDNRGEIYALRGEDDLARADFDRAIQIEPKYAAAYLDRGGLYDQEGDYDKAIVDCGRAAQLEPQWPDAFFGRGVAYEHADNPDQAMADFNQAIRLSSSASLSLVHRGWLESNRSATDQAMADYLQALYAMPPEGNVWWDNVRGQAYYVMALALEEKGMADKAVEDLKQLLKFTKDESLSKLAQDELDRLQAAPAATLAPATGGAHPALPAPGATPLVDLRFSDPASRPCAAGASAFGEFTCQAGELHMVNKGIGHVLVFGAAGAQNFVLQAQMRLIGDAGSYGVAFGGQEAAPAAYYIFRLRPAGQYELIRWSQQPSDASAWRPGQGKRPPAIPLPQQPSQVNVLIPWTDSPAIGKGAAANQLEVIVQGTRVTLLVNDQELASVTVAGLTQGSIGPVATEDGHAVVTMFRGWELP